MGQGWSRGGAGEGRVWGRGGAGEEMEGDDSFVGVLQLPLSV